jgi:hypothetical protein
MSICLKISTYFLNSFAFNFDPFAVLAAATNSVQETFPS